MSQKSSLAIAVFPLSSLLIPFLILSAPICSAYVNPGARSNEGHARSQSSSVDRSTSSNGLCNIKRQVIEVLIEGKDEAVRVPILRMRNTPSFLEPYSLPMGDQLNPKKSQRAILVDVGDVITKSDGTTQIVAVDVPHASTTSVAGMLRKSG